MPFPFDPTQLTQESILALVAAIPNTATEELYTWYQTIFDLVPPDGYGPLKPIFTEFRTAICETLSARPPVHWRVMAEARAGLYKPAAVDSIALSTTTDEDS